MSIDLHTHSTASDGTDAPRALGALASSAGLSVLALTDHDTTAGLASAAKSCDRAGVEFVPGIELSAQRGKERGTLHILGYFVDRSSAALKTVCAELAEARADRAPRIVASLNELGVDITLDEVLAQAGGAVIGRPHIAAVLVRKGYVKTVADGFARYIGQGKPAYHRKDQLEAARAIEAVHDAGGMAVLAHPIQLNYADDAELVQLVRDLVAAGLDGLETHHPDHHRGLVEQYTHLASRFDLVTTGGSDYHGDRKEHGLGCSEVSAEMFAGLREAHAGR